MKKRFGFCWLLACLCLTGCGFHLRQQMPIPPALQTLYLTSQDPYGQFEAILKHSLQLAGASMVRDPSHASFRLAVLSKNFTIDSGSIGTSSQARVYGLTYQVSYALMNRHGKTLLGPQTVTSSNSLVLNANQLLESNDQQKQMKVELERDVARQIITQLGSQQTLRATGQSSSLSLSPTPP